MTKPEREKAIWVFGDYRNYFQNRVTLQLLARARELAVSMNARVSAVIFGHGVDEWVGEYIAHGAQSVLVIDDEGLLDYSVEIHAFLLAHLARSREPDIVLVGATDFGREMAPRAAQKLNTGLTADCVGLSLTEEGFLLATAPSFGGNLLADIVIPHARPQMATVRPGTFKERPHDTAAIGEIVRLPLPEPLPRKRVRVLRTERLPQREQRLEDAKVVVCGGRGMGSKSKFRKLFELARLMNGEVGATRPVVHGQWADHDMLVGQAGRSIRPKVLFSFGISGAIQHTAGIHDVDFIIAVNKNPAATIMKLADVAIVADANQVCSALIRELKKRVRN